eukprot:1192542-Prorocentrum_minimum.AAC.5
MKGVRRGSNGGQKGRGAHCSTPCRKRNADSDMKGVRRGSNGGQKGRGAHCSTPCRKRNAGSDMKAQVVKGCELRRHTPKQAPNEAAKIAGNFKKFTKDFRKGPRHRTTKMARAATLLRYRPYLKAQSSMPKVSRATRCIARGHPRAADTAAAHWLTSEATREAA